MSDIGIVSELEALVWRLKDKGAVQIAVSLGDASITATFPPTMRPSSLPGVDEDEANAEQSKKEDNDLAYWSSN